MVYEQEKYGEDYWENKSELELKHFIMCTELYKSFTPKTLLDYGCGAGQFVKVFNDMGVDAYGFEPSEFVTSQSTIPKVTNSLPVLEYDVVMCMDVAEHVPIKEIDAFLKKIKNATAKSCFVVFSICFKGDPNFKHDSTHVTERTKEWWLYKLLNNGFSIYDTPEEWTWKEQMLVTKIEKEVKDNESKN